jgi:hypothetical protein
VARLVTKSRSGVVKLTATILGKLGQGRQPHIVVVPPNPGTKAQARLQVTGGATYCVGFGGAAGGTVFNDGEKALPDHEPDGRRVSVKASCGPPATTRRADPRYTGSAARTMDRDSPFSRR